MVSANIRRVDTAPVIPKRFKLTDGSSSVQAVGFRGRGAELLKRKPAPINGGPEGGTALELPAFSEALLGTFKHQRRVETERHSRFI